MTKITLTDYIDFISRSSFSKASKVKSIFQRPSYNPAFDFYKDLREEIIEVNFKNLGKEKLLEFLSGYSGSKKFKRYKSLLDGYLKFVGRKRTTWFTPQIAYWSYQNLSVKVNPEIGITVNGDSYLIKLYFKETPIKRDSIKLLLSMMENTLGSGIHTGYKCAILDVERGKLHYLKTKSPEITDLMNAEAEYFLKLWESLESKAA